MGFGFKDLNVWQKAMDFAVEVVQIADKIETGRKHFRLIEQTESCASSVAMNIAEGKGRYSKKEFVHFLHIARGSLYETVTLLCIYQRLNWIDEQDLRTLETKAEELAKMLNALIRSIRESKE